MRIVHCCLNRGYTDNYNYQENLLTRQNKEDGHEVLIISCTEVFMENQEIGYCNAGEYVNPDGIKVVRVPYRKVINDAISHKFRAYKGVYKLLEDFAPDVILFHGLSAWELFTASKYAREKGVKLLVDTHASRGNSATNWVSLNILHGIFYKWIVKRCLPVIDKVLCVEFPSMELAQSVYKIPKEKLEIWPLGGVIPEPEVYAETRRRIRGELGVSEDTIVFFHTGKMTRGKRTCELIRAFRKVRNDKFCLLVAGSLSEDIKEEALGLFASDPRVRYLGWKNGEELLEIMCGTDVYLQPGTVSASLQNALCYGCAAMVYPYATYKWILQDAGYYAEQEEDMQAVFERISGNPQEVSEKRRKSFERAKALLDYKALASRLYVENK